MLREAEPPEGSASGVAAHSTVSRFVALQLAAALAGHSAVWRFAALERAAADPAVSRFAALQPEVALAGHSAVWRFAALAPAAARDAHPTVWLSAVSAPVPRERESMARRAFVGEELDRQDDCSERPAPAVAELQRECEPGPGAPLPGPALADFA